MEVSTEEVTDYLSSLCLQRAEQRVTPGSLELALGSPHALPLCESTEEMDAWAEEFKRHPEITVPEMSFHEAVGAG